jgi:hypothetical protein
MLPYTVRQNEAIEYKLSICSPMIAFLCHGLCRESARFFGTLAAPRPAETPAAE